MNVGIKQNTLYHAVLSVAGQGVMILAPGVRSTPEMESSAGDDSSGPKLNNIGRSQLRRWCLRCQLNGSNGEAGKVV